MEGKKKKRSAFPRGDRKTLVLELALVMARQWEQRWSWRRLCPWSQGWIWSRCAQPTSSSPAVRGSTGSTWGVSWSHALALSLEPVTEPSVCLGCYRWWCLSYWLLACRN